MKIQITPPPSLSYSRILPGAHFVLATSLINMYMATDWNVSQCKHNGSINDLIHDINMYMATDWNVSQCKHNGFIDCLIVVISIPVKHN